MNNNINTNAQASAQQQGGAAPYPQQGVPNQVANAQQYYQAGTQQAPVQQPVYYQKVTQPGHSYAIASLALGIGSLVFCWWGVTSIFVLISSIVGLCIANKAKKLGNTEGINKVGMGLSIAALSISALVILLVVSCGGCAILGSGLLESGILEEAFNSGNYYY